MYESVANSDDGNDEELGDDDDDDNNNNNSDSMDKNTNCTNNSNRPSVTFRRTKSVAGSCLPCCYVCGFTRNMIVRLIPLALGVAIVVGLVWHGYRQPLVVSTSVSKSSADSSFPYPITYDPTVPKWNPYNDIEAESFGSMSPPANQFKIYVDNDPSSSQSRHLGYIMQPHLVNDTLVFVSDGDLYWARLSSSLSTTTTTVNNITQRIIATRLTVSVGNVRSPKLCPWLPYLLVFTATYQARRDIYFLNLSQPGQSAIRLTYSDSPDGVTSISGWYRNLTSIATSSSSSSATILYSTTSIAVGLRDTRLYQIDINQLQQQQNSNETTFNQWHVGATQPVPLAQAVDGMYHSTTTNNNNNDCFYFVRFQQSSWTVRYVGGTAESIWAYCSGYEYAIHLTEDYNGTSKHPTIVTFQEKPYLLFLSDRSLISDGIRPSKNNNNTDNTVFRSGIWRATTLNLFASPLPTEIEMYKNPNFLLQNIVQLTHVSCQFNGMAVREYTVDIITGRVLLRIGADLYQLSSESIQKRLVQSTSTSRTIVPIKLPIAIYSDFQEQQERLIPINILTPHHLNEVDVFETHFDTTAVLLTVRGQVWITPLLEGSTKTRIEYQGAGQNIPARRYRIVPGAMTGGAVRVITAIHIPRYTTGSMRDDTIRWALVLATDPRSDTAEHAFYLVQIQSNAVNIFCDPDHWPEPFVGGTGSTRDGGLGSVQKVIVSPCGRRFAWTDTDDRICVMTLSMQNSSSKNNTNSTTSPTDGQSLPYQCLPTQNDIGEPMAGTLSELTWSPGGRYFAVEHGALNQFRVITIVDCGDPEENPDIILGKLTQVTTSRFNSYSAYWGRTAFDIYLHQTMSLLAKELEFPTPEVMATTLYFVSDRDIISDVNSPWGSRAPQPHFTSMEGHVYALPLSTTHNQDDDNDEILTGRFAGGGVLEIFAEQLEVYENTYKEAVSSKPSSTSANVHDRFRNLARVRIHHHLQGRRLNKREHYILKRSLDAAIETFGNETVSSPFPKDADIYLASVDDDIGFQQKAYRMVQIPKGILSIVSQTNDDGSLLLFDEDSKELQFFSVGTFPSDSLISSTLSGIRLVGMSTDRNFVYTISENGHLSAVSNTATGITGLIGDSTWSQNQADIAGMAVSVWPALEYWQMYNDAWRMLRDYFYDPNLHNINWPEIHKRYKHLVERCGKREELDDVMGQMGSELSALHLFVYGGEYNSPIDPPFSPASLGVTFRRFPEWKGYIISEIPQDDPDFTLLDGIPRYCPLSEQALQPTGQKGLAVGDVIVAVNGESVMRVPDINMLLRGMAGRSIRLDVLRFQSDPNQTSTNETIATPVPVIAVPITVSAADSLRYDGWEWKTRQLAKQLAKENGFSVGYIHMREMDRNGVDAFARGFYPDYDKDGLIIDVRHNRGGNIDSWILTTLQRKAWMFWGGRGEGRFGELDWDEQFAFRGKVVVLIDEHTASNGEGVARGISELGIGKLVGKRTWGGGIWGSSENHLVDGGIAAAPQFGTFNDRLGWGGGVEMTGVAPDIEVDNDPRMTFEGHDAQLERAIMELKVLLTKEPVPPYKNPGVRPDMALHEDDCPA